MNKTIMFFLCFFILSSMSLFCQDDCMQKFKADSLLKYSNYENAINIYKERNTRLCDNYYMIAISYCKLNMSDSAEFYFNKAIEHNFYYNMGTSLDSDKYLSCLHNNNKLDSLVQNNYQKMFANINEELRKEFLHRQVIDQKVRHNEDLDSLSKVYNVDISKNLSFIDSINMVFLDSVLKVYGQWVGINILGYAGDRAAWLIAQHADNFVNFQEKCYNLLLEAYEKNNTISTNLPYLYDRIMINKGLKQRYATQIRIIDNQVIFINLENEDEYYIAKLRHCYGLISSNDYKKELERRFLSK